MSEENLLSEEAGVQDNTIDTGESQDQGESQSQATPSNSSYKEYFGDDGKISESFIDRYAQWDETADKKGLENFLKTNGYDLNRVFKQSLNLNKLLGKDKIPLPDKDAGSEVWDEFFTKLGAPGEDGDYEFDEQDVQGLDEDTLAGTKAFLKEAKIPQRLASRIVPALGKMLSQSQEQQQEQKSNELQQSVERLQASWGKRGSDEWRGNLAAAQHGAKIFAADFGEEDVTGLFAKYGNDPFLLRVFADKGNNAGEAGPPPGVNGGEGQTFTSMDERVEELNRAYLKEPSEYNRDKLLKAREKRAALQKS